MTNERQERRLTTERTGEAGRALLTAVRRRDSDTTIRELIVKLTGAAFSDGWDAARAETRDANVTLAETAMVAIFEELDAAGALTKDEAILAAAGERIRVRFESMVPASSEGARE